MQLVDNEVGLLMVVWPSNAKFPGITNVMVRC